MQFLTEKQNERKIQIIAHNSIKTNINSTKFLGLIIYNTLSWKDHIAALIPKLNNACYANREGNKTFYVCGYIENDLFFLFTFSHVIWYLGVIHITATAFLKFKKSNKNHYKDW